MGIELSVDVTYGILLIDEGMDQILDALENVKGLDSESLTPQSIPEHFDSGLLIDGSDLNIAVAYDSWSGKMHQMAVVYPDGGLIGSDAKRGDGRGFAEGILSKHSFEISDEDMDDLLAFAEKYGLKDQIGVHTVFTVS